MGDSVDDLVKQFGTQHKRLIEESISWLDQHESSWGLATVDREEFIAGLVKNKAKADENVTLYGVFHFGLWASVAVVILAFCVPFFFVFLDSVVSLSIRTAKELFKFIHLIQP